MVGQRPRHVRRRHLALNHDLGVGRDRQTGERAFDHLDRAAKHAAGAVELGNAEREFRIGEKKEKRIAPEGGDHRAVIAQLLEDCHFGKADDPMMHAYVHVHLWATAVKRPALAESPAKPREPYGVAELFRQAR